MNLDTDAYIALGFLGAILVISVGLGWWVISRLNR